jgi:transketolase
LTSVGAPTKAGTSKAHGSPLGAEEIKGAREKLGWPSKPFEIPAPVLKAWRTAGKRGQDRRKAWEKRLAAAAAPVRAEFKRRMAGDLPADFDKQLETMGYKRAGSSCPQIAQINAD